VPAFLKEIKIKSREIKYFRNAGKKKGIYLKII